MSFFVTSDYHLFHDRSFIYEPRGFKSIEEMNEEIVKRHNEVVKPNDYVYVLGDLMLGTNYQGGIDLINRMNGFKYIILGNHCTTKRIQSYIHDIKFLIDIPKYAEVIKYGGYHFYLSHYPTITSNLEKESLKQCMINLYGHTHQTDNFYHDIPWMYHCGLDSHNCYPCNLDDIIEEIKDKAKECLSYV